MRKIFILSLGILGFSSLVSQVIIVRELAMSFYANEFFIGWVLFCWLLGTSWGSTLGSKLSCGAQGAFRWLAICPMLTAFLFPLALVLIRSGRLVLGTPAGALPELIPSLLYPFAILVPFCGVMGLQFSAAAKAQVSNIPGGEPSQGVGKAYFWECLGFMIGGILFSFSLIFVNEFRVAAILAFLNLGIAGKVFHAFRNEKKVRWFWVLAVVFFPAWLWGSSIFLQQQTSQWRFPNETLVRTRNTVHGNVAVTRLGAQYNFYQSGLLLGADREDLASEFLVHFPMLAHPSPQKVLLLGTCFNGPIEQILKHRPQEVTAVELDPELLSITREFLPKDLQEVLRDPRIRFEATDPRDFFRSSDEKFDVIIANFPDPVSVLINRNYTEEFFRSVRSRLLPGGVFATRITFAANVMTQELERLGSSIYATLGQVFPFLKALPEDALFFLAFEGGRPSVDPGDMIDRLDAREIKPDFLTANQIRYRFTNDRVGRVETAFCNTIWKTKNTDLRPRTCYFEFLRWLRQFNPRISGTFSFLASLPFTVVLIVSLFAVLLSVLGTRGAGSWAQKISCVSMGTAGFSLMAFEIIVIYLFQAVFGDLYYRLAWVITAFMTGLGAGTLAALAPKRIPERRALFVLHAGNAAFFFLMAKIIWKIFSKNIWLGEVSPYAFLGMALWGGFVAGAFFPVTSRFYLFGSEGKRPGAVYAADLWGSALGALLAAGFFIPIWGVLQTLILLGAVNILIVLLLIFRKRA